MPCKICGHPTPGPINTLCKEHFDLMWQASEDQTAAMREEFFEIVGRYAKHCLSPHEPCRGTK